MKTPNKGELQQIAFNYSPDIDFRDFMNFYKKCTAFQIFSLRNSFRKTKQKKKNQEKKQIKTIKDQREKQIKALKNKVEKIFQTQIKNRLLLRFQKIKQNCKNGKQTRQKRFNFI